MKQLVEDIAKALVDSPDEVGSRSTGRADHGAGATGRAHRLGKSHRQARPNRTIHPHAPGGRRDETEPPVHPGNSGINLKLVTIARLLRARGNKGDLPSHSPNSRNVSSGYGKQVPMEIESTWLHGDRLIFKFKGVDSFRPPKAWRARVCNPHGGARRSFPKASIINRTWSVQVVDATGRLTRSRNANSRKPAAHRCWKCTKRRQRTPDPVLPKAICTRSNNPEAAKARAGVILPRRVGRVISLSPRSWNSASSPSSRSSSRAVSTRRSGATAAGSGLIEIKIHDLRNWTHDRHRTVDDRPFGGGEGMLLKPGPMFEAVKSIWPERGPDQRVVLLSAQGKRFNQAEPGDLRANMNELLLICGRYEGVDERVAEHLADEELSIGDFVLSGGELAAAVVMIAVARLMPGVLGNEDSAVMSRFSEAGLLDCPQYTRPAEFRGWKVPEVLLGGNHEEIRRWRRQAARQRLRGTVRIYYNRGFKDFPTCQPRY